MITIVIILIHIIGMFVYSFLNKDRIGKTEFHSVLNGATEYVVDTLDIVFESFFWELMLLFLIIISPILLIRFIIDFILKKQDYDTRREKDK